MTSCDTVTCGVYGAHSLIADFTTSGDHIDCSSGDQKDGADVTIFQCSSHVRAIKTKETEVDVILSSSTLTMLLPPGMTAPIYR